MHGRSSLPGLGARLDALSASVSALLDREFAFSTGHLTALLSGCVFAPSLFTFWFVNGLLDFSTAAAIGSLAGPGGLAVRVVAYLLLVPVFVFLRTSYYLLHPVHRRTVLAGSCPTARLLSLDWFSVGILATGLPLAFQDLGPWVGMNAVYAVGVFVLPRFVRSERVSIGTRAGALVAGTLLFVYARYGDVLVTVGGPDPATLLGPVATARLTDATTTLLLDVTNSLLTGPLVVAALAVVMNTLLTRPELTSIPYLSRTLPHRDPLRVVATSAGFGTVFYLSIVAVWTGSIGLFP